MCGIAGIWNRNSRPVSDSQIKILDKALRHRGPDGSGFWQNEDSSLALVHRRLAILDLSESGHQPMVGGEGRYIIVYNGEIYNFIEVKNELARKGYSFK